MRADRLLSLLLLLQNRGRLTAGELAAELEVSVRTVYRDVEALAAVGVPVYADRGPDGGYRLLDGYRTRLTGLNADEAGSLFLAGLPGPAAELGLGAELASARLKLLAALPAETGERAERIRERFHLDPGRWFAEASPVPHLGTVADAVWRQRALRIRYRKWGPAEVDRAVEPLGVVLKAGEWYLVAAADGGFRTYRVARILACSQGDPFERPPDFDLAAYWDGWSRGFQESAYGQSVDILLTEEAARRVRALFAPVQAHAVEAAGAPGPDGRLRVALPVESLRHAAWDLLRLGAGAEVLGPPELRERIAATARATAELYG
ncbi:helix-turn-helix transcriptional regulator [Peterkaempfera bronchialis]|uniref:YafY family transcriptional regulator n=1 Tax=Peterkaempfera bronchialis TaxID=2126346 RepID=A0A345SRV6_9ACTN|nr:YafY family protein [Peterkaempfera bronchialis]AXI76461.1 YafY family transcriptional regulator [Peterkaempfera bronchialis]